jgi:signal transduction histidine kinase/HAMP domain-containing protein
VNGEAPIGRVRTVRSIRFRVLVAFLAALIAMVAAQGSVVWQSQRVAQTVTLITAGYLPVAKTVAQLQRDRVRIDNDVRRIVREERRPGTGEDAAAAIWAAQLLDNVAQGMDQVEFARTLTSSGEEQAALFKATSHLEAIQSLFRDYQLASAELEAIVQRGDMEQATDWVEPMTRDSTRIAEEMEKLTRLVDSRIEALGGAAEADRVRASAISATLTAFAFGFALLLVGAVLYALGPIAKLTTEVQRLGEGKMSGGVEVKGRDEVSVLASEFNNMVKALAVRDQRLVERAEELNRLSRYLSSVLDSLEDSLIVVEDGEVTLANPAARSVWGAEVGCAPPEPIGPFIGHSGHADIQGPGNTLHELRTSPLGQDGVVVITADVTAQNASKARLARSERLALVGQMLAQITHEVRNPLNALSLNAELLGDEVSELDADGKTDAGELLEIIQNEIDRLTDVTGHYLQLARRPPAQLYPEDVIGIIRDVVRLLDLELESQKVTLTVDADGEAVCQVDGNQLRQALLNVIRNAVEAGGRNLSLSVSSTETAVRIGLVDDGPGMTEQEAERAIDPFFSTKVSGTGLGLAITKQILDDHDGTLLIRSSPGEGAEVTLLIPHHHTEKESHAAHRPRGG